MDLIYDWDETLYRNIAKKSESKQAVEDVKYARFVFYRRNMNRLSFRQGEIAILLGYYTAQSCRIIVVAVDKEFGGQGIGGALLKKAEIIAQKHGCKRIFTVTKGGRRFYEKYGYQITAKKSNGWEMTKKLQ